MLGVFGANVSYDENTHSTENIWRILVLVLVLMAAKYKK